MVRIVKRKVRIRGRLDAFILSVYMVALWKGEDIGMESRTILLVSVLLIAVADALRVAEDNFRKNLGCDRVANSW